MTKEFCTHRKLKSKDAEKNWIRLEKKKIDRAFANYLYTKLNELANECAFCFYNIPIKFSVLKIDEHVR